MGPTAGRYYKSFERQGHWVSGLAGKSFRRAGEDPTLVSVVGRSCLATLESEYHFTNARRGESLAARQGVMALASCMVIKAVRN